MNSAVKIITGWMKLVAPPVAKMANATIGIVVAVTSARNVTVMEWPRAARNIEMTPHATAKADRPRAKPMCPWSEPGNHSTAAPTRPVAVHMIPEVRSGSGPSSHGFPSACSGRLRLSLRPSMVIEGIGFLSIDLKAMAGHSKWASIKHKKKAVDAKRGALFTKLTRAITVAAREGGGDPDGNPALALAIQKARDASMPKDNIERAVAKGTGADSDADAYEAVLYEGYGPGGVAILVEALTDNRNRTGSEVRHTFTKHGGNLGEPGSVAWTFEKKGEIVVDGSRYSEDDLLAAIDAGAEDVALDGDVWEVVTGPAELTAVRSALEDAGVEIDSAELVQRPTTRTPVDEDRVGTLMRLIDALEENDDVQGVHANFDVDAEVLERVAAV
jgi:YebC/PmpR family DNA-binding regulatory protein